MGEEGFSSSASLLALMLLRTHLFQVSTVTTELAFLGCSYAELPGSDALIHVAVTLNIIHGNSSSCKAERFTLFLVSAL